MELSSPVYEAVHRRLHARFGPQVEPWWQALPAAIAELSDRWALTVSAPVGRGNTSLVLRCRLGDGSAAMLKLSPDTDLVVAEAASLRSWASSGRVPSLWVDEAEKGALLLEAIPGEAPLSEGAGHVPLRTVAELIGALHGSGTPVLGHGIVSLAERVEFIFEHWAERYRGRPEVTDVVSLARLQRGHELAVRLLSWKTQRAKPLLVNVCARSRRFHRFASDSVQSVMRAEVVIAEDRPRPEEVLSLYESVGWTVYTQAPDLLDAAVAGSSYLVTARADDELVGLARALSDDATICYLQDLLVRPTWQRCGIGRRLVASVLGRYSHVRQNVLLSDDGPRQRAFYEALGFQEIRDHGDGALRAYVRLRASG